MLAVVHRSESVDQKGGGVGRSRLDGIVRNAVQTSRLVTQLCAVPPRNGPCEHVRA
jgi:hypothetical protein